MTFISDYIAYIWLTLVALQIILPLAMFAVWQVSRGFAFGFAKREKPSESVPVTG